MIPLPGLRCVEFFRLAAVEGLLSSLAITCGVFLFFSVLMLGGLPFFTLHYKRWLYKVWGVVFCFVSVR